MYIVVEKGLRALKLFNLQTTLTEHSRRAVSFNCLSFHPCCFNPLVQQLSMNYKWTDFCSRVKWRDCHDCKCNFAILFLIIPSSIMLNFYFLLSRPEGQSLRLSRTVFRSKLTKIIKNFPFSGAAASNWNRLWRESPWKLVFRESSLRSLPAKY